jgi:short-subunit dehydrogenase
MASHKSVVVLGATSAMARAVAGEFARRGYGLVLAARDQEENEIIATDLRVRCNVDAVALEFEAGNFDSHEAFVGACCDLLGEGIEGVVLCFGALEPQEKAQQDFALARRIIDVNYTAAVSVLELFAAYFEARKSGFLCVVSSVAGDRGRQSNYLYGSAKAGLSAYAQGLRNRLFPANVHVTTIKPGFVDTKMTFGLPGLFLVAPAENAGKAIFTAIDKRKNVAYVPGFWHWIMLIVRHVPESLFKRLKM